MSGAIPPASGHDPFAGYTPEEKKLFDDSLVKMTFDGQDAAEGFLEPFSSDGEG